MLRFRRVFRDASNFNLQYDIYINYDFKLLQYSNDPIYTISVTDNSGKPINIPVYQFTGNEPYDFSQKQPAPFCLPDSQTVRTINEVNSILSGGNTNTSAPDAVSAPKESYDDNNRPDSNPKKIDTASQPKAENENQTSAAPQSGSINIFDIVNSGIKHKLTKKLGIENRQLCRIVTVTIESEIEGEKPTKEEQFCPIANFCLIPESIERHIYINNMESFINIAVFSPVFGSTFKSLRINAEDIEKVGKIVRQNFPQLYYDPDVLNASKYLSASLSMLMADMPEKTITHFCGWYNMNENEKIIFFNDNIDSNALFESRCGKSLSFDPNMIRGDAFIHTFRMLKLGKIGKTLPLFLFAHLSVMFSFFEEAGYPPRFVLFLRGETGSLKTSVSKVFFRILEDGNNEIPANFNDTATALEIKMGNTVDEVFLVDDFRPSAMNSELTKMRANLEKLIRFYGDGIGKGRGSISLKLREEFSPHGLCAVTGEYIHGTASSLQRLFIVSVEKNTYDRKLLKFYQDNPWYYRTHMNFFITYLSQNHEKIIEYISNKFNEKRQNYLYYSVPQRLVDAAVCLELTAEIILLFYTSEFKLVCPSDIKPQLDIWENVY